MTIALALSRIGAFVYFDAVVRHLCARGHAVRVLRARDAKPNQTDRALEACEAEMGLCESGWLPPRRRWRRLTHDVREAINYANYFRPGHPAPWLAERWEPVFSPYARPLVTSRPGRRLLAAPPVQRALRRIEDLVPPEPAIVDWLRDVRPDVIVASPVIYNHSREVEVVKAGRRLGIPTVVAVFSWDNLTIKGTFQVMPDAVMVWNARLADEAVALHDVPRERVVVTGAPVFDKWFEKPPASTRQAFAARIGLDPARPFVAYLCSSGYIARDETAFVRAFVRGLRERADTRDLQVVIRPHPANFTIWEGFREPDTIVWPAQGDIPDTGEAKADYYNTLLHTIAAVGVNTSAFLEAAIVDRPCLTIATEHYRRTQTDMPHFQHLVAGGFLETATSVADAAALVSAIRGGRDARADARRRFVESFVRPHGIDTPAGLVMAKAIEAVAAGARQRQHG